MTFLIGLFLRCGVAERFARPLAIAIAIIAAIALCASLATCWLSNHDKAVVQADRDKANIEVLRGVVKAGDVADAKANERRKQFEADSAMTKGAIDDAVSKQPEATRAAAGPATRAAADSLSERARKNREAAR